MSEQGLQFPSYTYNLYYLAYISSYYLILWEISDLTLHCTKWKYYYLCETIDKLYTFVSRRFDKDFGSSGCHEYYNVLCAKPLVCDKLLRVPRSQRSLENYGLT